MSIPTLAGIVVKEIESTRIKTRILISEKAEGTPILFLHGNASSATFWEEVMTQLPEGFYGIAPDQRGYGGADPSKKIDATRGMGDLADDAIALLDTLGIEKVHIAGHSMGGSVVWRILMDHPERILTVTQVCPGSPFGFGGTKGIEGTLTMPDGAGSGGGTINRQFAEAIKAGDRGEGSQASPRVVMNAFYWKPPFRPAREEELLSSVMSEHIGDQEYPGDFVASPNFPFVAPGKFGPANALSPIYADDVSRLYNINAKPSILWVRGSDDQIVGDNSLFDFGTLGSLGAIPNYPGVDVFPPQPMVGQTRFVLDQYQEAGGDYKEVVMFNTGHSPFIERPEEFNQYFHEHLKG